jgi:hypothetical protein
VLLSCGYSFSEGTPLPRTAGPYRVYRRRDAKKFIVTIYPASGLPVHVCKQRRRYSFANLPPELAHLRDSRTKAAAESAVHVLIEFLKKQDIPPPPSALAHVDDPTVGEWLGISYDRIATDGWDSFLATFGEDLHEVGKKHTVGIEGNNCRLRHRVRRAFRRTLLFLEEVTEPREGICYGLFLYQPWLCLSLIILCGSPPKFLL